jgi:ribosomal 50S subunit-recycling heat shock protein
MRNDTPSPATLRLDKWLWFARLARTRSLAARLCAEARVSIDGRDGVKPHHAVRIGDVIVVELPHQRRRRSRSKRTRRAGSRSSRKKWRSRRDAGGAPARHLWWMQYL